MAHVERRIALARESIEGVLRQWPVRAAAETLAYRVDSMAPRIRKQAVQSMRQSLLRAELQRVIRRPVPSDTAQFTSASAGRTPKNGRRLLTAPVPGTAWLRL